MSEAYSVKLEHFEGPLDLLLHLIKKHEVDLYQLSVSEITDQYLGYMAEAEDLNLDLTLVDLDEDLNLTLMLDLNLDLNLDLKLHLNLHLHLPLPLDLQNRCEPPFASSLRRSMRHRPAPDPGARAPLLVRR